MYKDIYDRKAAKDYAEKYAINPNIKNYPYFPDDDCTNFISQVVKAGGISEEGSNWDSFYSWFCNTNKTNELKAVSLTWRAARYFRRYFGKENDLGAKKAPVYREITVLYAVENFNNVYNFLEVGDIVQYANPKNNNIPYHSQVIHKKGFNSRIGRTDLFMAQHTQNRKNVSLFDYLVNLDSKEDRKLYLYKMD